MLLSKSPLTMSEEATSRSWNALRTHKIKKSSSCAARLTISRRCLHTCVVRPLYVIMPRGKKVCRASGTRPRRTTPSSSPSPSSSRRRRGALPSATPTPCAYRIHFSLRMGKKSARFFEDGKRRRNSCLREREEREREREREREKLLRSSILHAATYSRRAFSFFLVVLVVLHFQAQLAPVRR